MEHTSFKEAFYRSQINMPPAMPMPILRPIRNQSRKLATKPPQTTSQIQSVRESKSNFTDNEIRVIQQIWGSLDMRFEDEVEQQSVNDCSIQKIVPKLTILEVQKRTKSKSLKSRPLREFEMRLQNNIYHYFKSHHRPRGSPNASVAHQVTPEDFLFDLYLPAVLELLSTLIWQSEDGETTIRGARDISSNIWRFNVWHYNLIGEGIVSTILDMLGRDNFSYDTEYTWIKFYNKVANLVQSQTEIQPT